MNEQERCKVCGKVSFDSDAAAREELLRILETQIRISETKPCRTYWSERCNSYHLTHKPFITEY